MSLSEQLLRIQLDTAAQELPLQLLGPLSETIRSVGALTWNILGENIPRDLQWQYLFITIGIATVIWWLRDGHGSRGADGHERRANLFTYLFPKDIYTHVSARVDIGLWVTERVLRPFWIVLLLATVGPGTEVLVISSLEWFLGSSPQIATNYAWMLVYSLTTLLLYDLVFFLIHYAMHRFPALWALHKVHHSAEVLTPLTRYREHFLVGPIWAAGGAFSYGFVGGVFAWIFNGGIVAATLFNIGFFALVFGFNGSFRHYHVQFNYPRWLSLWLQSPAMHHVHHSYLAHHWDKNFAAVTSIWDRLFGTLYVPKRDEHTPWGIGPETQSKYRSYWQNISGPFVDWRDMVSHASKDSDKLSLDASDELKEQN